MLCDGVKDRLRGIFPEKKPRPLGGGFLIRVVEFFRASIKAPAISGILGNDDEEVQMLHWRDSIPVFPLVKQST